MISHLLNRSLEVWRPSSESDGMGGTTTTLVQLDVVEAKVDQPTAAEVQIAAQWEATLTDTVYLEPDADVRRGDELRGDGDVFRVIATIGPSRPAYLKALCEAAQHEGD